MSQDINIEIIPATLQDYPIIQNMARFYVYDRTRYMNWSCSENGMFECIDFKHYFETDDKHVFIIKVNLELAGFVMIDKICLIELVDWNMGEFFILAKFQNKGISYKVVEEIFKKFSGRWTVAVMPQNIEAVNFWRKVVNEVSQGNFSEIFKTASELATPDNPDPEEMNILSFSTIPTNENIAKITISKIVEEDINAIVKLSSKKRAYYEIAQPQFWRKAKNADTIQAQWFTKLLEDKNYIMLGAKNYTQIVGFIIGQLVKAPEVYNPKGLTLLIDDFCVKTPINWQNVGTLLLTEIKKIAYNNGATQTLVVCGRHDEAKRYFLRTQSLSIASEWYVG